MKRSSRALVAYSSSDEEGSLPPATKKRKPLPPLSLADETPIDNPALHQGRIRTKPHVEGQFAAHIYVSLPIERHSPLHRVVVEALSNAKALAPTLVNFWSEDEQIKKHELHISLSRPTYLRAHQREDLKKAVKYLSKQFPPFMVSFAAFSEFINDEKTRTFLALEVGAGHHELQAISNALTPTLRAIRQKEFYSNPRFHASIAWALLDRPSSTSGPRSADESRPTSPEGTPGGVPEVEFPTVLHLPKELVPTLNKRHGVQLSSVKIGTFDVNEIVIKIGKDVCAWKLSG